MSQTPFFKALPEGSRIPASSVRVVSCSRSEPKSHRGRHLQVFLVTVFTLRGNYALYAYVDNLEGQGGQLLAGPEVAVASYAEAEAKALASYGAMGFELGPVDLASVPLAQRIKELRAVPFEHKHSGDLTQGVVNDAGVDTETLFGDLGSAEALRILTRLMVAG